MVYIGGYFPDLGKYEWDSKEKVFAVRIREEDELYSCGMECCGVANYAVVAAQTEEEAKNLIKKYL